jgi:potassium-transporting ATPase KdpC subunit
MKTLRNIFAMHLLTLLAFGVAFPAVIVGIGKLFGDSAIGSPITHKGRIVGYKNIGQKFDKPEYFWGRPSAVNYNAAATGGSNLGPTNPAHLQAVRDRVDTLLKYHPGLTVEKVPADLVTTTGGGLDPHISRASADLQVARIAKARKLTVAQVQKLVEANTEGPWLGLFGPASRVNLLVLNLALDGHK